MAKAGRNIFQQAIDEYLANGGEIKQLPPGERAISNQEMSRLMRHNPEDIPISEDEEKAEAKEDAAEAQDESLPEVVSSEDVDLASLARPMPWSDDNPNPLPKGYKWVVPGAIYRRAR